MIRVPRYKLEPYKGINSRYTCPNCHRKGSFSRYIDIITGKQIAYYVGRCNHESSCGYHYAPRQYFKDKNIGYSNYISMQNLAISKFNVNEHPDPDLISDDIFKSTLNSYDRNFFVTYLLNIFGLDTTIEIINKYFIGTSDHWEGATIFWQIDSDLNIRSGKIMLYNPITGKRVRYPYSKITWVHSILHLENFHLDQCYFGEHLLKGYPDLPVGVVESEKTAIIASVYYPNYVWLAVGSINNLKIDKLKSLRERDVILFPDLNGYDKWTEKVKRFDKSLNIKVSPLLNQMATEEEYKLGLDLADFLLRFDLSDFQKTQNACKK